MYISIWKIVKKLYEQWDTLNSRNFQGACDLVLKSLTVGTGVLLFTSCQFFPKSELLPQEEATKTYQGRIAFKQPNHSFVTIFRWLESGSTFQLTLRDRLALGGVRVQGNENHATIEYSNGDKEEDVDLDDWIESNLGISLPFEALWKCLSLTCKLIDEATQREYDSYGRLEQFSSDQWTFKFSYKEKDPESTTLKKLEMNKDDTNIRIFFTKFKNQ